jgi:hypothetical protein
MKCTLLLRKPGFIGIIKKMSCTQKILLSLVAYNQKSQSTKVLLAMLKMFVIHQECSQNPKIHALGPLNEAPRSLNLMLLEC